MKKIICYAALYVFALSGCMKDEIPSAGIDVSAATATYRVGDTVLFEISGDPDNIVFYSGEPGHNYALKDRIYADNDLQIEFTTLVQWGVIYQNLQLLVSTDFNGIYDKDNINAATWTDISDEAVFSTGADHVSSGVVSLAPYLGDADTVTCYVAFRYTDDQKPGPRNRWIVRTFTADIVSPEGVLTHAAALSTAGWNGVSLLGDDQVWSITTAQLLMHGGPDTEVHNDDWVITKGFKVKESVPDRGVAIKNISTKLGQFEYVYNEPGEYRAVFETSSVWYSGSDKDVKEVLVRVEP